MLEETSAWCNESRKTALAWSGGEGGRLHAHREEQSELPRNGGFNKSKIRKPRGSSTVCYFFFFEYTYGFMFFFNEEKSTLA